MEGQEDELREIIDGASISSISLLSREGSRAVLALIIIAFAGPAAYGIVSAIERTAETIRYVVSGVFTTVKRTVPRRNPSGKNTVVMISGGLLFAVICIFSVVILLFRERIISQTFLIDAPNNTLELSILFTAAFVMMIFVAEVLKSYKEITLANIVFRWASPIFQIIGVLIVGTIVATIATVLYGMILGLLLSILVGVGFLARYTSFSPIQLTREPSVMADYWNYFLPAVTGRIFVGLQLGIYNVLMFFVAPTQAGVFGIALILAMLVRLPLDSVDQIFPQVASELYDEGNGAGINALFQSTSKIAVIIALPLTAFVIVFHSEIAGLFAEEYQQYSIVLAVAVIGQLYAVMVGTVGFLIMMTDNQRENMYLQFILTIVTLGVAIPLTIQYNVYGLAFAITFGFVFNNTCELFYLWWREELFSLTRQHLYAIIGTVPLLAMFYVVSGVVGFWISVPIAVLATTVFIYGCFSFLFTAGEKRVFEEYFADLR